MSEHTRDWVTTLSAQGVQLLQPASTFIGPEVNLERISAGVIIHPGCRIVGATTQIGPDCEIGAEAPMTIDNCQLASGVQLKGGYAAGSVFLDGASVGSGAQIRPGCLLEEHSSVAHSVGLKQTILFPYATLGSLINFCDCLLAGGTGPKDHSEVGSGFIHFNFTPDQTKATPSLFGDVARGVFVREDPIFLGGQAGVVGPAHVGYGAVLGAGSILRRDLGAGMQWVSAPSAHDPRPVRRNSFPNLRRIVEHNLDYIAQLVVLRAWYQQVRILFFAVDPAGMRLHDAAVQLLSGAIAERSKRLSELAQKVAPSTPARIELKDQVAAATSAMAETDARIDGEFTANVLATKLKSPAGYLATLAKLPEVAVAHGTETLQTITRRALDAALTLLPNRAQL